MTIIFLKAKIAVDLEQYRMLKIFNQVFILTIIALPVTGSSEPVADFSLMGHRIGDSFDYKKLLKCERRKSNSDESRDCISVHKLPYPNTGVKYQVTITAFEEKVVMLILNFKAKDYEHFQQHFINKYGKPHSTLHPILTNSLGAKFKNDELTWNTLDGKWILHRYLESLNNGGGIMADEKYLEYKTTFQNSKTIDNL